VGEIRLIRPPSQVQVDVVFDAADVVKRAPLGPDDTAHIGIQTFNDFGLDPRLAVLGREDNV
jgi:hypothetical protein